MQRVTNVQTCFLVRCQFWCQGTLVEQDNTEKLLAVLVALGDARVMLIKLAGRLQLARSMQQLPAGKREQFLLVTERLFIPVANRLGVWAVKAEMEDLCFQVCSQEELSPLCHPHDCASVSMLLTALSW